MKKSLVALAALAVVGGASAQVSIDGNVDVGFRARSTDAAADKFNKVQVNNASTTAFFFRGNEDIGGGLKAGFLAELDWNPTQSQTGNGAAGNQYFIGTPFNGEQFISLAGGFGTIKAGTPNSSFIAVNAMSQPFGTAIGGGYMNTGVNRLAGNVVSTLGVNQYVGGIDAAGRVIRYERALRYESPVMNGIQVNGMYVSKNGNQTTTATKASDNTNGVAEFAVTYNNGPLNLGYVSTTITAGPNAASSGNNIATTCTTTTCVSGTTTTATWGTAIGGLAAAQSVKYSMLAGNYNLGAITLYAGVTTGKTGGGLATVDTSSNNYAVKWQATPELDVGLNVVSVKVKATADVGKDSGLVGMGLNYFLSKRSSIYYRYENGDTNKASATAGGYTTQAVGMRHTF